ncbi:MAG: cation:proton antiporter [Planctomycetaceae bacterium]
MHHEVAILVNLSVCLSAALVLGFVTHRLRLSPIVGYLLAGIVVGPQTPGFVADPASAAQFAEIGVILLMFGVGLHFDLRDLLAVRRVALPGALGQVLVATLLAALAVVAAGWGWKAGTVVGLAVSVASTVVLIRVLADNNVLDTDQGHIAVGWLVVEDLFTVLVLVLLPALAAAGRGDQQAAAPVLQSVGLAILKISLLAAVVLWAGRKIIPRILERVAQTRTRELFTLAILALALTIATGSAIVFGVSMALGAFLAGMVVGQSEVSHQAAADALPMRDAFAVLFFVAIGMLFDPSAIVQKPALFSGLLGVILIVKPLTAVSIVWALGYSVRTALTVAVGLSQIGEFSFILADLAADEGLLEPQAQSLLVACAIVSISLNPLLFRGIDPFETWLRRQTRTWKFLTRRAEARAREIPPPAARAAQEGDERPRAIIVGYGPVGKTAAQILKDFGIDPVIVDLNVDTVRNLSARGDLAVYGDAAQRDILEAAGIATAKYLLITTPDLQTRTVVVIVARELNPEIKLFVRARYLGERAWLEEIGATEVCYEEAEAAIGLASLLLREVQADEGRIQAELQRIRSRLGPLPSTPASL